MSRSSICPICKHNAKEMFHPFCSKRCQEIDLHRWLQGNYVVNGIDGEASHLPIDDEKEDERRSFLDDHPTPYQEET